MRQPVIFIAHGTPMNILSDNHFTQDWQRLFGTIEKPNAIVVFSAHWHISGTQVLSTEKPRTIHDFSGFPEPLYQQQYDCPGSPDLASQLVDTLIHKGFKAKQTEDWGLDHGSWIPLKVLFPEADIPVLQISMDSSNNDVAHHLNIAESLREFRDNNILFVGSGNIVHNIAKWMRSTSSDPIDWAVEFDNEVAEAVLKRDIDKLINYKSLPYASEAVPTIEHYLPLIYCMGLTDNNDQLSMSEFPFKDLSTACSRSFKWNEKNNNTHK